jgi:hypothetical protein
VGSGVVEGTRGYDAAGDYTVEVTATDPFDLFATQSFNWTINDTNREPVSLSEIPDQGNDEGDTVNLDAGMRFSDPDGDTLRFEAGSLPAGVSIDENSGIISGVLTANSSGNYITLILVYDSDDAATSQTFNWTVADTITTPLIFQDGFE